MRRLTLLCLALCLLSAACGESFVVIDDDERDPIDMSAEDGTPDQPRDMRIGEDLSGVDMTVALDMADDISIADMSMQDMPEDDMMVSEDMMQDMTQDMDPFIGKPCMVSGVAGQCLPTAACDQGRVSTPGRCPGPADIQCCTQPPQPQPGVCDPNARPTPNAGLIAEPAGMGGCPPGMARVDTFCVDRWEAALVEVRADGSTASWSPYFNPGSATVRAVSAPGLVPQGYISGRQAAAACAAAGKRLCTDQEWLRACQGAPPTTYPYGQTRQPGVCNDARAQHPAVQYFGPNDPNTFSKLGHPCINQLPDSLDKTGDNPGCITQDGLYDMMGNLHEWTADPNGTFRGGFYVDTYRNGNGCLYRTTAHDTGYFDYSTGFRCCADGP